MTKRSRPPTAQPGDQARTDEAKRILDRVSRESETVGSSTLVRSATQAETQMSSGSNGSSETDPVEILGRKIGRTLGWIAVVFLVLYLVRTYVFK